MAPNRSIPVPIVLAALALALLLAWFAQRTAQPLANGARADVPLQPTGPASAVPEAVADPALNPGRSVVKPEFAPVTDGPAAAVSSGEDELAPGTVEILAVRNGEPLPWAEVGEARPELFTVDLLLHWADGEKKFSDFPLVRETLEVLTGREPPVSGSVHFKDQTILALARDADSTHGGRFRIEVAPLFAVERVPVRICGVDPQGSAAPVGGVRLIGATESFILTWDDWNQPCLRASLLPGEYQLSAVTVPYNHWQTIRVHPPEAVVTLEFPIPHEISVQLPAGVEWVGLSALAQGRRARAAWPLPFEKQESGEWVGHLPDGEYCLTASARPEPAAETGRDLAGLCVFWTLAVQGGDETHDLRGELPALGTLRLTTRDGPWERWFEIESLDPPQRVFNKGGHRPGVGDVELPVGTYRIGYRDRHEGNDVAEGRAQTVSIIAGQVTHCEL
jgi:hypothetical protein